MRVFPDDAALGTRSDIGHDILRTTATEAAVKLLLQVNSILESA